MNEINLPKLNAKNGYISINGPCKIIPYPGDVIEEGGYIMNYRFRTNFFGKEVLQIKRFVQVRDDIRPRLKRNWVDADRADAEDLLKCFFHLQHTPSERFRVFWEDTP